MGSIVKESLTISGKNVTRYRAHVRRAGFKSQSKRFESLADAKAWLRNAEADAAQQRLEADGVILRRVALVDQNKIGLGISVFVSVESSDHSEAWLRKFADAVSAMPEVMEFYRMVGDVDYMLRVVVADMPSYDVFYKKLISAVPLYRFELVNPAEVEARTRITLQPRNGIQVRVVRR